jgi:hypothetical protein
MERNVHCRVHKSPPPTILYLKQIQSIPYTHILLTSQCHPPVCNSVFYVVCLPLRFSRLCSFIISCMLSLTHSPNQLFTLTCSLPRCLILSTSLSRCLTFSLSDSLTLTLTLCLLRLLTMSYSTVQSLLWNADDQLVNKLLPSVESPVPCSQISSIGPGP